MGARLLIQWDSAIDGEFRRRMERAFENLMIEHADVDNLDPQTVTAGVPAFVAAPGAAVPQGPALKAAGAIVIIGGPAGDSGAAGDVPGGARRLEVKDLSEISRRWTRALDMIGARISRPGLSLYPAAQQAAAQGDAEALAQWAREHADDPLANKALEAASPAGLARDLAATASQLKAASASSVDAERRLALAEQRRREVERLAAEERDAHRQREAELSARIQGLELALDSALPLADAPTDLAPIVAAARSRAWDARVVAVEADRMALTFPDALSWPNGARYSGETANSRPHGLGVLTYPLELGAGPYRGEFRDGRREGLGVGASAEGHVSAGAWSQNSASGLGVLQAQDGRRFEGQVEPSATGPIAVAGWRPSSVSTCGHSAANIRRLPAPKRR